MSTLKRFVVKLLRKFWDRYPKIPLIYICSRNGVTGAVRADDFDDEVRSMRKSFVRLNWPIRTVRPQVYPVFLFSDKSLPERNYRVAPLIGLKEISKYCVVEFRDFELPPITAKGFTPHGYFGELEMMGREGTRHRIWTLRQAAAYLVRGKILEGEV